VVSAAVQSYAASNRPQPAGAHRIADTMQQDYASSPGMNQAGRINDSGNDSPATLSSQYNAIPMLVQCAISPQLEADKQDDDSASGGN